MKNASTALDAIASRVPGLIKRMIGAYPQAVEAVAGLQQREAPYLNSLSG